MNTIEQLKSAELPTSIYMRWTGGDLPFFYKTKEGMMEEVREDANDYDVSDDWYLELKLNELAYAEDSINIKI